MRMNRGKRAFIVVLAAILLGNSLDLPGSVMWVSAKEVNAEENKDTVSGNSIVLDNPMEEEQSKEEQPKEEQPKEEQEETIANDAGDENSDMEPALSETDKTGVVSELMHIGQTYDREDLPYPGNADCAYDKPISLMAASESRLFVNWSIAADAKKDDGSFVTDWQYSYIGGCGKEKESDVPKCPYEGLLTWSVLRKEAGTEPGTTNIVNGEDDWADFETVSFIPGFTIREDEDENSGFYKTLTITADNLDHNHNYNYDYYIRATFEFMKDQVECIAITTVPVTVAATGSEDNLAETQKEDEPADAGAEDDLLTTKNDEELTVSEEEDQGAFSEKDPLTAGEEAVMETEETAVEDEDSLLTAADDNVEAGSEEPAAAVIGISKFTLNKTSVTMNPQDTVRLSVTIVPEGLDPNISWFSSNHDVATVDEVGNVMAIAEGDAEITAECEGKTAGVRIEVVKTDAEKNGDQPTDEEGNVIAISDEVWVAGFERESDALTYTGGKLTQNLRIYHKGTLLKEKTDYVLTYKNNVNAAVWNSIKAPSVTITMKGQYTGSRTLYFTIAPREIDENHSLGYEQVISYSRQLKIPAPSLYFGSKKLVFNKDFVCDYSSLPENYTKGEAYEDGISYEYTVNGKGNFTGSFTMKLAVIKDKDLNFGSAVIALDKKQYEYHGEALSVSDVQITSVKLGKNILDPSLYEYKVLADGVGNGLVEVYPSDAGRSEGYRGKKKLNIKVVGDRNIKNAEQGNNWQNTITFSKKKLNNNGGICQEKTGVLIFCEEGSSEPLTEGVDYTVKYSNNKKVGTATVTFTGKGRYTGSFKKTYKIMPNTELDIKWHDTNDDGVPVASYMKGGAIPAFDLVEAFEGEEPYVLSSKTDYTVKVKNNKKPGIMTCEITGKGNYKGYKSITEAEVISADISQGTISVSDKQYSKKLNAWKSAVTIKDVNGKKLTAGTDYDKKLIYSYDKMEEGLPPEAGTIVYVTAVGRNNYEGSSVTGSYRIYSTNLSKLTVLIDAQEYTGKEIELSADDIHVYANKNDVKKGKEIAEPCYEIVKYSNNRKAGTAKVTLRGIEGYGGTRTCSFKINKKKYLTTRVTKISLDADSLSLGVGSSRQLTAAITPEDAWNKTVIWTTSNSKIATVNEEGVVTAKQSGKATITATAQDTGKKATCKVTVAVIPITSFSLNATEVNQCEGTQFQLTVTEIQPADATDSAIQWESTNPEIAAVDASGRISLNKAGMAVIKAYANKRQVVRKCLVFVSSKEETEPEGAYLTPQMFRTSEEEDDTKAFNEAIKSLSEDCDTVYIPAGTYKINAEKGIRLKSNMNFVMSKDAVIKAVGNSGKYYNIIYANNISNVTISGGRIIGERYEHGGTAGEWGMGIGVYDSTNINIHDINVSECWGDGIYLGSNHEEDSIAGCKQITIKNCNAYRNRRNNLSIVCADYVTVDNCSFYDANGTAPEFGIDIETNNTRNPCEHITISNSTFEGNAQGSMGIITSANDINISGCMLNGDFVNYAGTNVTISDSAINGEMNARIGVSLVGGTRINDGGNEEDILVASFCADKGPYTIGKYGIDDSNLMSHSVIEDSTSPSGKALCLARLSKGTKEAGYYLKLSELTEGTASVLEKGVTYRFEYVVKGSGQWGIKTDQTGWYPCVPMSDKFSTGIVTYKASSAKSCRLMLYAVDKTKDMYMEIDSIKIYKVR